MFLSPSKTPQIIPYYESPVSQSYETAGKNIYGCCSGLQRRVDLYV
jgi:hypothetical protein